MIVTFRIWRKFQKRLCNGKHLGVFSDKCYSQSTNPPEKKKAKNTVDKIASDRNESGRMSAWQIHSYGSLNELQFSKSARLPSLMSPNEVLVKVLATSVNPIDVMMISGYGSLLLNTLRQFEQYSLVPELEFPLIMGRDCCGEIVSKGNNVDRSLNVGDIVYGVVPVHLQGCHAEHVVLSKDLVKRKPESVSLEEAASLLFTGMTAWSALKVTGDLWLTPSETKNVLIIGASGGVGTVAIQLLKAWGAQVVAVCSEDAIPVVKSLGPDHIVDYKKSNSIEEITKLGKYDIIFDAAGLPESTVPQYTPLLKDWSFAKYITLRSPFLKNMDQGFISGICQNARDIVIPNLTSGAISRGSSVRWAFFMPLPNAINELNELIELKKVKPVVQKVFKFSELPTAYKMVQAGHLRGKIVIKV